MKNTVLEEPANLLKIKTGASFKQIPADSRLINQPKFEVEKLNFYYGSLQVLHNISVAIPSYGVTSIIGPSGTGKSTFLRLLNRMSDLVANTRVEGHIMLDGKDIFSQISPVDLRYRVGMVFQQPNPFPKTIYDNVAYGPRMHGLKDKKKLDEVVETSLRQSFLWDEVKDQLRLSALSLSGGQQQRLCIARSLAVGPEVLLMDEPCSALDPIATFKIEELILGLSGSYTIILVTHNMQQAARISDYTGVFMLVSGQTSELVEFGRTVEVFTNPKKASTEAYLTGRLG